MAPRCQARPGLTLWVPRWSFRSLGRMLSTSSSGSALFSPLTSGSFWRPSQAQAQSFTYASHFASLLWLLLLLLTPSSGSLPCPFAEGLFPLWRWADSDQGRQPCTRPVHSLVDAAWWTANAREGRFWPRTAALHLSCSIAFGRSGCMVNGKRHSPVSSKPFMPGVLAAKQMIVAGTGMPQRTVLL